MQLSGLDPLGKLLDRLGIGRSGGRPESEPSVLVDPERPSGAVARSTRLRACKISVRVDKICASVAKTGRIRLSNFCPPATIRRAPTQLDVGAARKLTAIGAARTISAKGLEPWQRTR